jgi:hypothetical protein
VSYRLEITLAGLPRTTNSNVGGWRSKWGHSRIWRKKIAAAIDSTQRPTQPLKKARITLTRYSSRRADFDGLVSSFKHILDGLIDACVIADDSHDVIGQPNYIWQKVGQNKGHVRVLIEEPEP